MKEFEKKAFFDELAEEANYTDPEYAKAIYIAMVRLLLKKLRTIGEYDLPDFGKFTIIDYKGKRMRDINSGEMVQTADTKSLRFESDYKLRQYVKKMKN